MALDASRLDTLFEDDWTNLYKPLQIIDTNMYALGGGTISGETTANIESKLNELLTRQDALEDKVYTGVDTSLGAYVKNLENKVDGLKDTIDTFQEDVSSFLNSFNHWENQSGEQI